jgi:hypothetical protein
VRVADLSHEVRGGWVLKAGQRSQVLPTSALERNQCRFRRCIDLPDLVTKRQMAMRPAPSGIAARARRTLAGIVLHVHTQHFLAALDVAQHESGVVVVRVKYASFFPSGLTDTCIAPLGLLTRCVRRCCDRTR